MQPMSHHKKALQQCKRHPLSVNPQSQKQLVAASRFNEGNILRFLYFKVEQWTALGVGAWVWLRNDFNTIILQSTLQSPWLASNSLNSIALTFYPCSTRGSSMTRKPTIFKINQQPKKNMQQPWKSSSFCRLYTLQSCLKNLVMILRLYYFATNQFHDISLMHCKRLYRLHY